MSTWIVLLRGINVGGHNLLPMKALALALEQADCRNVRTYIQSGNVVLDSPEQNAGRLAEHVAKIVDSEFGFRPITLALRAADLAAAMAANPYPEAETAPSTLHLFFLERSPQQTAERELEKLRATSEAFTIGDKVVYLHAPDGIGRSKLAAGAEKASGVTATARNWRTVSKLKELADR